MNTTPNIEVQRVLLITHKRCILDYGLMVGSHTSFVIIGVMRGAPLEVVLRDAPDEIRYAFN